MTTPYFVSKSPKSVAIAILLTFTFGPVGLFYASITGGLVMTFTPIFWLLFGWSLGLLTICALTFWLISMIWAVISVSSYNREIEEDARRQYDFWNRHHETTPNQFGVNINQKSSEIDNARRDTLEVPIKPDLRDWLKSNAGKTINDYFTKFGR